MGPRKHAKILCECLGITEAEVFSAIRGEELTTVKQVTACTDAGGGCTACHPAIRALIERRALERAASSPAAVPSLRPALGA